MSEAESKGCLSGLWSCLKKIPWKSVLRCVGICCGFGVMAVGLYNLFTFDTSSFSVKAFVNYLYQTFFGLLMVVAEFRWIKLLRKFSFLTTYVGLGLFYVFVGGLALGSAWYEILLAVVLVFSGLMYFGMGCCLRYKMYTDAERVENALDVAVEEGRAESAQKPPTSDTNAPLPPVASDEESAFGYGNAPVRDPYAAKAAELMASPKNQRIVAGAASGAVKGGLAAAAAASPGPASKPGKAAKPSHNQAVAAKQEDEWADENPWDEP